MFFVTNKHFLTLIVFFTILFCYSNGFTHEQRIFHLKKGDNLALIFKKAEVSSNISSKFIDALRYRIDLKKLSIGQEFKLLFDENKNLISVVVPLKRNKSVLSIKSDSGKVNAHILNNKDLEHRLSSFIESENNQSVLEGTFDFILDRGDNLNKILSKSGVSTETIFNISTIISEEINLYKLKPGDKLSLSFMRFGNEIKLNSLVLNHNKKNYSFARDAFGIFRKLDGSLLENKNEYRSARESNLADDIGDNVIIELLRSIGLSYKESERAAAAFSTVSDPNDIIKGSDPIIPPLEQEINSFAIKVSDADVVLVHKDAYGDFVARKSDIKKAKEFISKKNRMLKNNRAFRNTNHNNFNIITSEISDGDTLINLLLRTGINIKQIRKAIWELKKVFNPNKISVGKKLIIASYTKPIKLAGFFLETKNNKGVLITTSHLGFRSKITNIKVAEEKLQIALNSRQNESSDPYFLHVTDEDLLEKMPYEKRTIKIKKGDTLIKSLTNLGISKRHATDSLEVLKSIFNPKSLKSGQTLSVVSSGSELYGFSIEIDMYSSFQVIKEKGKFKYYTFNKPLTKKVVKSSGIISTSLYKAAMDIKLPMGILMEMVNIYSFDIDFQRDIRPGDGFEVMYEHLLDDNGNILGYGDLLLSTMIVGNIKMPFYRFEYSPGKSDYFDDAGYSVRKALMRTPISGARLSSRFGKRKHPILGFTKMHKGVDFAAPRGTPIYSAGDGVIEKAGRFGGYGKYIRIRHNSDYSTAYAHLYKFAKNIFPGKRVKQGTIIGFVGSTGRSTGPHLHYEIHFRGKAVNPRTVNLPKGIKLSGIDLDSYKSHLKKIKSLKKSIEGNMVAEEY